MEALWPTTGPAKNLIDFACRAANPEKNGPRAIVTIATYHRGAGPASNDFVRACEKAGLEIHVIRERFLFDPAVIPAIHKLVVACNPDIVQSHAVKSHFLIRLTALHRKRPWIAFHHGYTWTSQRTRIYNHLDRWSLLAARKLVTVCRPFVTNLQEIGVSPERIVVQHNSVKSFTPSDQQTVSELRRTLGISEEEHVVLCAGRLSREKAQADFIEAVAFLRDTNPQIRARFVIAGDGPDRQMLTDRARTLGVDDRVIFTGQISDLVPFYTMATLVVLPSHSEGSPNVLLEAMAAGLPIIATDVGGVPEIVANEKQALLVEKQNPLALAQAMARMLQDSQLRQRLAEAALQGASAYSPAAYCEAILSLYNACLEGNDKVAAHHEKRDAGSFQKQNFEG